MHAKANVRSNQSFNLCLLEEIDMPVATFFSASCVSIGNGDVLKQFISQNSAMQT